MTKNMNEPDPQPEAATGAEKLNHCDDCDWTFDCWNDGTKCRKRPVAETPYTPVPLGTCAADLKPHVHGCDCINWKQVPPTAGADAVAAERLLPFRCENCGSRHTPEEVIERGGNCLRCGDTVTVYTVDAAECILRLVANRRTAPAPSRSLEEIAKVATDNIYEMCNEPNSWNDVYKHVLSALTAADEANGRRAK